MSWIATTLIIVAAIFAAFFLLCEWLAGDRKNGGDGPSAAG